MTKTNKELAVELTASWIRGYATIASNPNVTGAVMPKPSEILQMVETFEAGLERNDSKFNSK